MKTNLKANVLFLFVGLSLLTAFASTPQSKLFEEYKNQIKANKPNTLPNFSYAGYEFGEKAIPNPQYQVFNVKDFGAIADDNKSDKIAIQTTIEAAEKNGSGIVYFPKGTYLINEKDDKAVSIKIKGNNIILRGETGAVLFMQEAKDPTDPAKMWTTPHMFDISSDAHEGEKLEIAKDANVGSFTIETKNDITNIKGGDWVSIGMVNNNHERITAEMMPYEVEKPWTSIQQKGVVVKSMHLVKSVTGNKITLYNPVIYPVVANDKWTVAVWSKKPQTGVGIENLLFKGNFLEHFVHHRSSIDDSGWSILKISKNVNSWIKDCIFENVSAAVNISGSANVSVIGCKIIGNGGHTAIDAGFSTNVLIAKCIDTASQWHTFGVIAQAMNTVVWRCVSVPTTCFESHASQPRNTLLDCVSMGLMSGRGGGALQNMPNHMQGLILWNYNQTNAAVKDFDFWPNNTPFWRCLDVTIAGGFTSGTTFKARNIKTESIGVSVLPESLYEAQLELRMGKLPDWMIDLKK